VIGRPREGFSLPSFSPGGGRIAVAAGSYPEVDIWIVDVNRGTPTRLTFGERTVSDPTWTPDGKRVLYSERVDDAPSAIMITYADGSGEPQKVTDGRLFSLSPDGRYVVFSREGEETEDDIWYVPLDVEAEPVIVVQSAADEIRGRVSPDGAYIAYESDESGVREIYIKRFPSGEGKWQASIDGGHRPRWSPKGDELFWIMDGHLTVVDVQTEPELKLGTPRNLFSWRPGWLLDYHEFDITDDAERFVLIAPEEEPDVPNQVMLVENWFAEFDLIP
jgi:serine/threonine-protein kinase